MTAFAACTSGGSSTGMPAIVPAMAQRPVTAMGIVTIRIPPVAIAPRGGRGLTYVSSATRHAALFINGASAAAGSTTSCSSSSCTISWSLSLPVPAGYVFAVEIDSGSSGSPPNTVLAENAGEYLIHAGSNTLATLTLNGVAGSAALSAESCTARDCLGTLTIEDAAGSPITSPGSTFDNTQVAVGSSNTGTGVVKVPGTPITAVSSNGQYSYDVNCQIGTNTFALNVQPPARRRTTLPPSRPRRLVAGSNLSFIEPAAYAKLEHLHLPVRLDHCQGVLPDRRYVVQRPERLGERQ